MLNFPFVLASEPTQTVVKEASRQLNEQAAEYHVVMQIVNNFVHQFLERLPYLIVATLIMLFFWLLSKLFRKAVVKILGEENRYKHNLLIVVRRIGRAVILFVGFMLAMVVAIPDFTPATLIQALGLGSVAVGFAFKDIFQNLISGIILLLTEPFRIGDQIIVNQYEGTVESIQIRATIIRTYDGRRVVIPNAEIFTSAVTVNTAYSRRRLEFIVGIGYDEDIATTKSLINQCLKNCKSVSKQAKPSIVVTELADSTVNLKVRWYIDDGTQANKTASTDEVITQVKNALTEAGVDMPYPIQQMVFTNTPLVVDNKPQPTEHSTSVATAQPQEVINSYDAAEHTEPIEWDEVTDNPNNTSTQSS